MTTAAYLPQARKVFVEKHTKDLSLGMYVLITSGLLMWCIYGIVTGDWPVIVANAVSCLMSGGILIMKLRCG